MRTIQEGQTTRLLDPDSESEAEQLEDPCEAVLVGLEHGGKFRALANDPCSDQATGTSVRLLESDRALSDVRNRCTVKLCDHHRQLYVAACNGRKCSVQLCYEKVKGARHGVPLCIKHLTDLGAQTRARRVSWQGEEEVPTVTDQSENKGAPPSTPTSTKAPNLTPRRRRSASAGPQSQNQHQVEGKLQQGPCIVKMRPQCLQHPGSVPRWIVYFGEIQGISEDSRSGELLAIDLPLLKSSVCVRSEDVVEALRIMVLERSTVLGCRDSSKSHMMKRLEKVCPSWSVE